LTISCKNNEQLNVLKQDKDILEDFEFKDFMKMTNSEQVDFMKMDSSNFNHGLYEKYKNFENLNINEINQILYEILEVKKKNILYTAFFEKVNLNRKNINYEAMEDSSIFYYDLFVYDTRYFYHYFDTKPEDFKNILKNYIDFHFENRGNEKYKDSVYKSHHELMGPRFHNSILFLKQN
jgi:hypothetical protein